MSTYMNHLTGLSSFLTTYGLAGTHKHTIFFDYGSEFKQVFNPSLRDFNIKPVLTTIKIPPGNTKVEWVHQVIFNNLVIKDLDNKFFDYIHTWGETLAYIEWVIRASYYCTIMAAPGQAVLGKSMIFNLVSFVD